MQDGGKSDGIAQYDSPSALLGRRQNGNPREERREFVQAIKPLLGPITMKTFLTIIAVISFSIAIAAGAAETPKAERARLDQIQKILSPDVPRILCLDENFATGAQPTGDAYVKAAA